MLNSLEHTLCKMQGKLFEMTLDKGYDSEQFIRTFMRSQTAADLDKPFDHMQWAGESYIMDRLHDEESLEKSAQRYDGETLYWTGYLYRYWHYYTGETSRQIYKQVDAKTMRTVYLMYHTMSPEMVIDRLKETYASKKGK